MFGRYGRVRLRSPQLIAGNGESEVEQHVGDAQADVGEAKIEQILESEAPDIDPVSILAWGALATVNPSVLAVSYETYTAYRGSASPQPT
jgi:hypothetical protein